MAEAAHGEPVKKARFEGWVRDYSQVILRTCFVYLADKQAAEDAMQDTFLKAWKAMDGFLEQEAHSAKAWLLRIAINRCRDYQRSRWFRHVDRTQALEDLPQHYLQVEAEDRSLFLTILGLPVKQKQVILLYYYHRMPMQEVAQVLGVAVSTVHARLKKAEQALKMTLTGGDDND